MARYLTCVFALLFTTLALPLRPAESQDRAAPVPKTAPEPGKILVNRIQSGEHDHLAAAILQAQQQQPTLVVWLFDATYSAKRQRLAFARRFKSIYETLSAGNKDRVQGDQRVLSVVVSYGKEIQQLTAEPTDDVAALVKALEGIQDDPSGIENTFSTIKSMATQFLTARTERGRNLLLIVVTDEVGTDQDQLEETMATVRRCEMAVHVVGPEAPFGRKQAPYRFVTDDPQYAPTPYWMPLDRGPESYLTEVVRLPFWNQKPDEFAFVNSGFGPHSLMRLTSATGGTYFIVSPSENGAQEPPTLHPTEYYQAWDSNVLRRYAPDYVSKVEYEQLARQNKARYALLSAADLTDDNPFFAPDLRFVQRADVPLVRLIEEAQKRTAVFEPKLRAVYEVLKQGEADRTKLSGLRWQAGYDLAMGRVMAQLIRAEGCQYQLAAWKRGPLKPGLPFADPQHNTWVLTPSANLAKTPWAEKLGDQANTYLQRVLQEHPGTPWTFFAERELAQPLGWEWKEEFTAPPLPAPEPVRVPQPKPFAPRPKM